MLELARGYAAQQNYGRARRWWTQAAQAGHAGAELELALCALHGLDPGADLDTAVQRLQRAAEAGIAEAAYWCALLECGRDAPDLLRIAQCWQQAIDGGHAPAIAALRPWQRDDEHSAASIQRALRLSGAPAEILHADLNIAIHDDVLSAEECAYLVARATPWLQPAQVVDPATGAVDARALRNNASANLPDAEGDLALRLIERRLTDLCALPWRHAEALALLRYQVGEEYRPHLDVLPASDPRWQSPGGGGQRQTTVFVYLNPVAAGGHTAFPRLGIEVEPRQGRALRFDNLDREGRIAGNALHAGMPVQSGEKWLATLWLRQRPLRPW